MSLCLTLNAPVPYKSLSFYRFVVLSGIRTKKIVIGLTLTGAGIVLPDRAAATRAPEHLRHASGLELATGATASLAARVRWGAPSTPQSSRALSRLKADVGEVWTRWNDDTGVPQQIITAGTPAPGTVASAREAERMARDLLARHIDVLAPGSDPADFVLVANEVQAGIRSVGFHQYHRGQRVVGGQVGFAFKADRLSLITSTALPSVSVVSPSSVGSTPVDFEATALDWMGRDVSGRPSSRGGSGIPVVLPIADASGLSYRQVVEIEVDMHSPPSRWAVYLDASTGEPVARRQLLSFASARLRFRVPRRSPSTTPTVDRVAPLAEVSDQVDVRLTDANGLFLFDTGPVTPSVRGPLVEVVTEAGTPAGASFDVVDGGEVLWDPLDDEFLGAQLAAFVHTSIVKEYVRQIDPTFEWLDDTIPVNVNIEDECNAFSDGNSINFFIASPSCENTGLIADVVYHEFGHSVHIQSLVPGVGQFNGALSEGVADYLSATITDDSGIGRGFFYSEQPLRELDPIGSEWRWPEDRGEVHDEGRIIGGALWDLRKLLIEKLGDAGRTRTDLIYYEATRRAIDIPSMYPAALLVDDDDGNLANGTPNGCEINAAFGAHGLYQPVAGSRQLEELQTPTGKTVRLSLSLPSFEACPITARPELIWRVRGDAGNELRVEMQSVDGGYEAQIPAQPAGTVVQYAVASNFSNGTPGVMPENAADPWYETFFGETIPLYCFGDEDGSDWTFEGPGAEGWSFGGLVPGNGSDPTEDFDGDGLVLAQNPGYSPNSDTRATSPVIDTQGYQDVRLHYRRWLTVEDGFFDRATIRVDGETVWANPASEQDFEATFHHLDREWRFQDLELGDFATDGQLSIAFGLASDGGLEFGGWTLDALCVVAVDDEGECGNGVLEGAEQCDDGNLVPGDGCSDTCVVDEGSPGGESSGSGGASDSDGGSEGTDTEGSGADASSDLAPRGCACTSAPVDGSTTWMLGLLALGGWARPRRRNRA